MKDLSGFGETMGDKKYTQIVLMMQISIGIMDTVCLKQRCKNRGKAPQLESVERENQAAERKKIIQTDGKNATMSWTGCRCEHRQKTRCRPNWSVTRTLALSSQQRGGKHIAYQNKLGICSKK